MKSIDFSKGVRGKYANMNLRVVGEIEEEPQTAWAIWVTNKEKTLIPLKLYQITYLESEIKVVNELGKTLTCPQDYFLLVKLLKKEVELLNSVSI